MKNFLTQGEFQEENRRLITEVYKAKEVETFKEFLMKVG